MNVSYCALDVTRPMTRRKIQLRSFKEDLEQRQILAERRKDIEAAEKASGVAAAAVGPSKKIEIVKGSKGCKGSTTNKSLFKYNNSLGREYKDTTKTIEAVKFPISRYGAYKVILNFEENVTEMEAIRCVEHYLSQPLTQKYYNMVRHDLYWVTDNWEADELYYQIRGDLLSDARDLDRVEYREHDDETGSHLLTLIVGS